MVSMASKPALLLALGLLASPVFAQDAPKIWDPEEKWGKDIAKFEAADEKSAPPMGAYLFTGSSSVRLWDLPEVLAEPRGDQPWIRRFNDSGFDPFLRPHELRSTSRKSC